MSLREKILAIFKTSAKTSKEITYFAVLLFSVLTLPVLIAAATQPFYKRSQAIDPCPKITTTSLPGGIVGKEYGASVDAIDYASSYPLTMEFSSLPPGVSKGMCAIGTSGGAVTISCGVVGTPTKVGNFTVTVTVKDRYCKVSRSFALKITSGPVPTSVILSHPPIITTNSLPDGTMGRSYKATVVAEDKDGDSLTMKIHKLSYYLYGLYLNPSSCRSLKTPSLTRLSCYIEGNFNHPDVVKHSPYQITLIAEDDRGAITTKSLQLTVRKR